MKNTLKNNIGVIVKLNKFNDDLQQVFENVIQPEMARIFDANDDKFIVVEEIDGVDVLFLFTEINKTNKLIDLLVKHDMVDFTKEITEDILMGDLDEKLLAVMASDEFKVVFDTFILKNLNPDMVLDKILLKGMDALTENDKFILEQAAA